MRFDIHRILAAGLLPAAALLGLALMQSGLAQEGPDEASPDRERVARLIAELGSESAAARDEAYRELKRLGERARPGLERAAGAKDPLLRDNAARLLEELAAAPDESAGGLERLRRQRGFPALPGLGRGRAFGPGSPQELAEEFERLNAELDDWHAELERWMDEALGNQAGRLGAAAPFESAPGSRSSMQSFQRDERGSVRYQLEVAEDGRVSARVEREVDGETTAETYEAESMAAFRDQHPEIAAQMGLAAPRGLAGRQSWFGRGFAPGPRDDGDEGRAFGWPRPPLIPQPPGSRQPELAPPPAPASGPRLGVHVRPIESDEPLRSHVVLDEGIGLLVVDVIPGSLAEQMDLRPNDILVQVGSVPVGQPEEIRAALLEAGDLERLELTVLRQGTERVLRRPL